MILIFSEVAESQKRDDEAMDTDDGDGRIGDKSSIQSSVESIKVCLIHISHILYESYNMTHAWNKKLFMTHF